MSGHSETSLPMLGLALTRRPPAAALPLLLALYEWCLPTALDPAAGTPAAVLATAEGLHLAPAGVPFALWARPEDLATPAFATADVVISDDLALIDAAGKRGMPAPTGHHLGNRRPMSPFVRERLRKGRSLAPDAILEWQADGWLYGPADALVPISDELAETALGVAAAVSVTNVDWLVRSLVWGAPTVTSRAAADALGLRAPGQVLVAATRKARTAAAVELAHDPVEAARLSWQGYRRIESLDVDRAAVALADRLRLWPRTPPSPAPPLPTVELALRLLGTPADAHVRTRLAEASYAFTYTG